LDFSSPDLGFPSINWEPLDRAVPLGPAESRLDGAPSFGETCDGVPDRRRLQNLANKSALGGLETLAKSR
jgi:hypothetical protein